MKNIIQTTVILLALLLPLASPSLANEQEPGRLPYLRLNQAPAATSPTSTPSETALEVLEQVANLFNSERGLAISDNTSILLLCNQTDPLDDPDYQSGLLSSLSVGLKVRF